jgi:hypothetical protein
MDVTIVRAITELLVVTIPAIVVSVGGLLLLSRSRLGVAVARRIAGDSHDPAHQEQLDALQDEVLVLRSQLSEMHERIEFAERLLSQPGDAASRLRPSADQVQRPAQQGRY